MTGRGIRYNRLVLSCMLGATVLFALYAFFNPAETWWMPKCPIHFLTGWDCPGCGSQRALHALLHGRVEEAFHHNAFILLFMPFLILFGISEYNRTKWPRLYRKLTHPALLFTITALILLWGVGRNLVGS